MSLDLRTKVIAGLVATLGLLGCDQRALFEKFVPEEEAAFAKDYIALFQVRDFDSIEARMDPDLAGPELRQTLEQIAGFFPPEKPIDIQTVGAESFSSSTTQEVSLGFQYEYPSKWLLTNVVLRKQGDHFVVKGIHVQPLPDALENTNRFTFEGKGVAHYFYAALAIIVSLLILTAFVICVRTPIPKRKWLWIVFVLTGLGKITLNWSDGSIDFSLLSVQLLGASLMRPGPLAPWLLSVSLPIGAVAFLLKRKRWSTPSA